MDVKFASFPVFGGFAFQSDAIQAGKDFQAYWLDRLGLVGDVAVTAAIGRFVAAGRIFSTSFKLAPGVAKLDTLYIPFTLFVEKPGFLHLALDVGFYKGVHVFNALKDATARAEAWLKTLNTQTLLNALGADAYNLLTSGGTITNILADVEMPPAWLIDP